MIIRKTFPLKEIVDIQEELKKLYGDNFVVIEINRIKKKPIPFLPFFAKEYTEVIIEIPEEDTNFKTSQKRKKQFDEELLKEIFTKQLEELKKEINSLKEEIKTTKKQKKVNLQRGKDYLPEDHKKFLEQLGDDALNLFDLLLERGFSEKLAVEILKEATGYDIENKLFDLKDNNVNALSEAFEKLYTFQSLESNENPKVVVLVGPTGVGKTTTIAKIVSNLVLNNQKTVGVVSLDTFRVGGAQRLESFLKVLEIPFRKADTKKAFDTALEDFADKDFIFVDIAGRSVYDELSWNEVFNILHDVEEERLLPLLTLSFNMSSEAVKEIYEKLKNYKLKGLVLTKADETVARGVVLSTIKEFNLPVFYITNGQKVPHHILQATPTNLAKLVLDINN